MKQISLLDSQILVRFSFSPADLLIIVRSLPRSRFKLTGLQALTGPVAALFAANSQFYWKEEISISSSKKTLQLGRRAFVILSPNVGHCVVLAPPPFCSKCHSYFR